MTRADPLDHLMSEGDPAGSIPERLTARIIANVPKLPQVGPEPVARIGADPADAPMVQRAVALPRFAPRRRFFVPLGLAAITAAAASLAAVFLSSAQGWQGPAMMPAADNAPAVAAQVASPGAGTPSVAGVFPVPELAASGPGRVAAGLAIRPAATPVLAQGAVLPTAVPTAPVEASSAPVPELAIHGDDAPIQQLGPAEAAAIERRADRRAAREAPAEPPAAPVAMGLRGGPAVQTGAVPEPR